MKKKNCLHMEYVQESFISFPKSLLKKGVYDFVFELQRINLPYQYVKMTAVRVIYDYMCCQNRYPSTFMHNNQHKTCDILFRLINFSCYERKKNRLKLIGP